ncbi:hypothetical protein LINPERPRIM_LOCUS9326, partial [Linum perenne]
SQYLLNLKLPHVTDVILSLNPLHPNFIPSEDNPLDSKLPVLKLGEMSGSGSIRDVVRDSEYVHRKRERVTGSMVGNNGRFEWGTSSAGEYRKFKSRRPLQSAEEMVAEGMVMDFDTEMAKVASPMPPNNQ